MSIKSLFLRKAIEGKLPNWIYRFAGRRIADKIDLQEGNAMETKRWYQSKSVWTAIIGAILGAVQPISLAFGNPIVIPAWVFEVLGGLGLYSLRTGEKIIS